MIFWLKLTTFIYTSWFHFNLQQALLSTLLYIVGNYGMTQLRNLIFLNLLKSTLAFLQIEIAS